jgi:type VI secretion system secreted protein VgrG
VAFTQEKRLLRLDTPLGADVLLIDSFRVREAISSPFVIHIDAISELTKASQVTAEALIGKKARITVALKEGERYFHGMICRLSQGGRGSEDRFVRFQLEVVPLLVNFANRANCRIFQGQTVPDIVKRVLTGLDLDFRLKKTYRTHDYCVQYRETDLNFVSRLMEDEGIFYFFKHGKDMHTMVLADNPDANQPCPVQSSVHFEQEGGYGEREDTVVEWTVSEQLRPGLMTLRDHNFQLPDKFLEVGAPTSIPRNNDKLEIYDYPGEYAKLFKDPDKRLGEVVKEGEKLVHLRMQREETAYEEANGTSNVRTLCTGFRFTLKDHYKGDWNTDWLLTSVQHSGVQTPNYVSEEGVADAYSNRFTSIPYKIPFLPERSTPKPVVRGPHTAVVVGPPGEEIFPDKFGRVKVQFFWDREGKMDENSSCWIRVAQPWAGKNWGFVAIPRIGHEVVVEFLEGDPDRPIIVGSVYNADNMPPYELPGNQTQTGVKTRSSSGGGSANFNEIRFEDKKGSEELFFHAEKDLTGEVEENETRTVGKSRTTTIQTDDKETVKEGDHTLTVSQGNREATISMGNDKLTVSMGNVTHEVNLGSYDVTAMTGIKLTCGASSIELKPAMIVITSPMVKIN